jgi:ribosomal-protein-alanine N-acetyltransferase
LKELETVRLRLRAPNKNDAAFIATLMTCQGYVQNIGDRGVHSQEDATQYLRTAPIYQTEDGMGFNIVELSSTGEPFGICGLVKRDAYPWPDVGYALLDGWEGNGYASEAAERVISHAFDDLQLPELLAITSAANKASRRVVERLGMTATNEPSDDVCVYRIVADGWRNQQT